MITPTFDSQSVAPEANAESAVFDDNLEFCSMKMDLSRRRQVANELMSLKSHMYGLGISEKWFFERYDYPQLGSRSDYMNYELKGADGKHIKKPGNRFMWRAINLTWNPNHKNSTRLSVLERQEAARHEWVWNPGFELPETKRLVAQLEPERLVMARAMWMPAGNLGFFHVDGNNIWNLGYQQINIILQSGGSPFVIRLGSKYWEVDDDVFAFNDRNLHGVPKVSSDRLLLIVTGKFPDSVLRKLTRKNTFISSARKYADCSFLNEFKGVEPDKMIPQGEYNFRTIVHGKFKTAPASGMAEEILKFRPYMKESHVSMTFVKPENFHRLPLLAPEGDYAKLNAVDPKTNKKVSVPGGVPTFYAMNFTESPSEQGFEYGLSSRSKMIDEEWQWSKKFPIPITQRYLKDELGLLKPLMCRALYVPGGGFVPFHKDAGRPDLEKANYRQVNITLKSGGSPLLIAFRGRMIRAEGPVFTFKDLYYHGVPKTEGERLVLVVCGLFDPHRWNSLLDHTTVIEDMLPFHQGG